MSDTNPSIQTEITINVRSYPHAPDCPIERAPQLLAERRRTTNPATSWVWGKLSEIADDLVDDELLVLLACAEHADRSLWTGDGYGSTSALDVLDVLGRPRSERARVSRMLNLLHRSGLLVEAEPYCYRIPESAFD